MPALSSNTKRREPEPQRAREAGVGIRLERSEGSSMIRLKGTIDIACATELRTVLLDALTSGNPVRVALDGCADMDVTAAQLLWAAEREATALAVGFRLDGPVPETLWTALKDAGFERFPVPV